MKMVTALGFRCSKAEWLENFEVSSLDLMALLKHATLDILIPVFQRVEHVIT